jgi:hypothetical protein
MLKFRRRRVDTGGQRAGRVRRGRNVIAPGREEAPRFSIGIGRTGGTVVITVHGVDGLDDWERIDAVLRDIIDAQGNLDVLLDLGEVRSLESDAAPLIVHAAQRAHSHGGRLRLADRACRERS